MNVKHKILPHLLAVLGIFIFSIALFTPAINGGEMMGPDTISAKARYKYINDYKDETGEIAHWNPSQFAGDPRVLAVGKDSNLLSLIHKALTFNTWYPIGMFFALGICMYLSLSLMEISPWVSLSISIAYMLSYIFFTLFEAGHGQKIMTVVYAPLVVSGTIMLLNKKQLAGAIALLLGTSLSIYVGHVQMVFYLMLALVAFGIPLLIFAIREKEYKSFMISISLASFIAILALGTDYAQLKSTYDFSKQTMRGGSILDKNDKTNENKESDEGLQWEYAMNWSFEAEEFLSIVVPRIVGGGSQEKIDKNNELAKLMIQNGAEIKDDKVVTPAYWGNMPFTSGGPYIGASVFGLVVIALILVERKYAFAFTASFLMIYLISLGKHAEWFNRLLFDHLPMFSKFRAPNSVTSILPSFIFLLAGMGLHQALYTEQDNARVKRILKASMVNAGFFALLYAIGSSAFSFLSENEVTYPYGIQKALIEGRKVLFQDDVLRSLMFLVLASGVVVLFLKKKIKSANATLAILTAIFILDLLPIDKRLVGNDDFVSESDFKELFAARQADLEILREEPNGRGFYRVLDLSVNTFNDAKSCYYHNQIGGYSATKMQRYEDMINYHIRQNNNEVLNMLNTKYIISEDGQVQQNSEANGPAWFVNQVEFVDTDLEEISALYTINTKETAVVKKEEFGEVRAGDGNGNISLQSFSPNKMVYSSSSDTEQLAVFSETWYNGETGWIATVNGKEVPILRTNYILRAIEVPAGNNEIVMEFKPVAQGKLISLASSGIAWLIILLVVLRGLGVVSLPGKSISVK